MLVLYISEVFSHWLIYLALHNKHIYCFLSEASNCPYLFFFSGPCPFKHTKDFTFHTKQYLNVPYCLPYIKKTLEFSLDCLLAKYSYLCSLSALKELFEYSLSQLSHFLNTSQAFLLAIPISNFIWPNLILYSQFIWPSPVEHFLFLNCNFIIPQ